MKPYKFFNENKGYRTKKVFNIIIHHGMSRNEMNEHVKKQSIEASRMGIYDEFRITLRAENNINESI